MAELRAEAFRPERFAALVSLATPLLTPEQLQLTRQISYNLARDPAFMRQVEEMLQRHSADFERIAPETVALVSSGWQQLDAEMSLPSPKAAAAAVGAAVGAMAAGAAAAVVPA